MFKKWFKGTLPLSVIASIGFLLAVFVILVCKIPGPTLFVTGLILTIASIIRVLSYVIDGEGD